MLCKFKVVLSVCAHVEKQEPKGKIQKEGKVFGEASGGRKIHTDVAEPRRERLQMALPSSTHQQPRASVYASVSGRVWARRGV